MDSRSRATPVGDIAGVEGSISGSHPHHSQLMRQERDVGGGGGGGERVDIGEGGGREDGVDLPLVEGHRWVGLVGAVESDVGAHWGLNVGVINTNTVDDWLACQVRGEQNSYLYS